MYLRLAGLALLVALFAYAVRRFQPTRFGLLFGVLLLYIPLHDRMPLNLVTMVNALTMLLAVLVVSLPADRGALPDPARTFRSLVIGFCVATLVGVALSPHLMSYPTETATELKRWLDPALFGLLALALTHDRDRHFAVVCMTAGYLLVAVQGVREGLDYGAAKRIPGLLGQSNETGAFLAMYAPLLLTAAPAALGGMLRWVPIAVVPVGAAALVFTESRGSMIAFAAGIAVTLFVAKRTMLASGLVLAGVLAMAVPDLLPDRVVARFEQTTVADEAGRMEVNVADSLEEGLEPSAADRIKNWKAAAAAMMSNPQGVGFGQFRQIIGAYGGVAGLDAHNFFFLVGAELGLAGLALTIALFVKMGRDAWALSRTATSPLLHALGAGGVATVAAAVIVNCFGSRFMQEQPSTYLWVIAAIVVRARAAGPVVAAAVPVAWASRRSPVARWQ